MANSSKTPKKAKTTKEPPAVQYAAVSPQPKQPKQPRRPAIAAARRVPVHYTPRIPNAGCPTC